MSFNIKISPKSKIKVKTSIAVPESLSGVDNVDITNVQDGYVLMYDDTLKKYAFVSPNTVLSKSAEDSALPQNFVDQLDVELDNKIDFDGGDF
jgi:hypothetical protein